MGLLAEVTAVSLAELDTEELWGRHIDFPVQGTQTEIFAFEITGWVLGKKSRAIAVEVVQDGKVLRRVPLSFPRPDLTTAFPHVPKAARGGFRLHLNLLGKQPDIELQVNAIMRDRRRVPLGVVRGRRCWRVARDEYLSGLVSVVIPCYQQAHFLGGAIESVLAQTYPHYEIVVIDDGSTDNTGEVAARYPGVRCIRQENAGLSAARNAGIRHTNGDYLVFLDADDRLLPRALEVGFGQFRAHPEAAFVAGACEQIAIDGRHVARSTESCDASDYYLSLLRSNCISMPGAVMYRRSVFEWVRGFDESLSPAADYDLYLRIARDFPIWCHAEPVAEYRLHGASMSNNAEVMLPATIAALRAQRKRARRKEAKEAYRYGKRFARRYYGRQLVEEARVHLSEHRWRSVLRSVAVLARYHPGGLASLVRPRFLGRIPGGERRRVGATAWRPPARRTRRNSRVP
jgi:glycosyltransferase involved in cell wall biosynthesis